MKRRSFIQAIGAALAAASAPVLSGPLRSTHKRGVYVTSGGLYAVSWCALMRASRPLSTIRAHLMLNGSVRCSAWRIFAAPEDTNSLSCWTIVEAREGDQFHVDLWAPGGDVVVIEQRLTAHQA